MRKYCLHLKLKKTLVTQEHYNDVTSISLFAFQHLLVCLFFLSLHLPLLFSLLLPLLTIHNIFSSFPEYSYLAYIALFFYFIFFLLPSQSIMLPDPHAPSPTSSPSLIFIPVCLLLLNTIHLPSKTVTT